MSQTENYIVLKPIAERFANVASSISDAEIRDLIKSELRQRIKDVLKEATDNSMWKLSEVVEGLIDDNQALIESEFRQGLARRLG